MRPEQVRVPDWEPEHLSPLHDSGAQGLALRALLWTDGVGCTSVANPGVTWKSVLHSSVSELRTQEMVSVGLGSKPLLNIKPSDAAINGRAVNHVINGTGKVATALSSPCSSNWDPGSRAPRVALSRGRSLLSPQRALSGPCIEAVLLEQRPDQRASLPCRVKNPSVHGSALP